MGIGITFSHSKGLFKIGGRIIFHHRAFTGAWTVIPTYTDMRVISELKGGVYMRPFLFNTFQYVHVIIVHVHKMSKLVMCSAGKAELFYKHSPGSWSCCRQSHCNLYFATTC